MARAKSPLRYLAAAWADFPNALREPQTIRKATWFVLAALMILFGAAAKRTQGPVHLVMALALFGTLMAIGLTIGAVISNLVVMNRPDQDLLKIDVVDADPGYRARRMLGLLMLVSAVKWMMRFGLITLPMALEELAGIPFAQATRMLTGTAIGLGCAIVLSVLWAFLAVRAPHRVYLPEVFPRWWFRASMFTAGIIGAAVALDPAAIPKVLGHLVETVLDI